LTAAYFALLCWIASFSGACKINLTNSALLQSSVLHATSTFLAPIGTSYRYSLRLVCSTSDLKVWQWFFNPFSASISSLSQKYLRS